MPLALREGMIRYPSLFHYVVHENKRSLVVAARLNDTSIERGCLRSRSGGSRGAGKRRAALNLEGGGAKGDGEDAEAFRGINCARQATGLPILSHDSLLHPDRPCRRERINRALLHRRCRAALRSAFCVPRSMLIRATDCLICRTVEYSHRV